MGLPGPADRSLGLGDIAGSAKADAKVSRATRLDRPSPRTSGERSPRRRRRSGPRGGGSPITRTTLTIVTLFSGCGPLAACGAPGPPGTCPAAKRNVGRPLGIRHGLSGLILSAGLKMLDGPIVVNRCRERCRSCNGPCASRDRASRLRRAFGQSLVVPPMSAEHFGQIGVGLASTWDPFRWRCGTRGSPVRAGRTISARQP